MRAAPAPSAAAAAGAKAAGDGPECTMSGGSAGKLHHNKKIRYLPMVRFYEFVYLRTGSSKQNIAEHNAASACMLCGRAPARSKRAQGLQPCQPLPVPRSINRRTRRTCPFALLPRAPQVSMLRNQWQSVLHQFAWEFYFAAGFYAYCRCGRLCGLRARASIYVCSRGCGARRAIAAIWRFLQFGSMVFAVSFCTHTHTRSYWPSFMAQNVPGHNQTLALGLTIPGLVIAMAASW